MECYTIKPQILNWEKKSYGGFMENHQGIPTKRNNPPITNQEHLTFMVHWVCTHFICTKSIKVPTSFYNLAFLVHIGEP